MLHCPKSSQILRRQTMPRITTVLRQSRKAIQDLDLLKVLQSEIRYEQSLNPDLDNKSGPTGDFVLDWDSPQSQDVVLRKKYESGEEVAVSALLGPEISCADSNSRREVLMKICIKKPGLSSILQFDCGYSSEFDIHNAYYIPLSACLHSSVYKGPSFSSLDPQLQDELRNYLVSKGIDQSFGDFLLHRLHNKEQSQYLNWLRKLEAMVAGSESSFDK